MKRSRIANFSAFPTFSQWPNEALTDTQNSITSTISYSQKVQKLYYSNEMHLHISEQRSHLSQVNQRTTHKNLLTFFPHFLSNQTNRKVQTLIKSTITSLSQSYSSVSFSLAPSEEVDTLERKTPEPVVLTPLEDSRPEIPSWTSADRHERSGFPGKTLEL
jgi:hypothetical protein